MIFLYLNFSSLKRFVESNGIANIEKAGFSNVKIQTDSFLFYYICRIIRIPITRACFDFSIKHGVAREVISNVDYDKKILIYGGPRNSKYNASVIFKSILKNPDSLLITHGYRRNHEKFIKKILDHNEISTIIFGLGAPMQEQLAFYVNNISQSINVHTCGAFIEQSANSGGNYYPVWIQIFELRWFYRILNERGIFKRIVFEYSPGLIYLLKHKNKLRTCC